MTELERVIVDKPATSLELTTQQTTYNIQEVHDAVIKNLLKLDFNDILKYNEGLETEKNKSSSIIALIQDVMLQILDNHEIQVDDKNAKAVYLQNKKITRDLLISSLSILRYYVNSDVSSKTVLLGKLIQSLHDRRY